jgi:hypothetical protein
VLLWLVSIVEQAFCDTDRLLQFSTLGGLLFGYDQGVVSGIITMESFGARFPRVYSDSSFKGWFVSTLLLGMFVSVFF